MYAYTKLITHNETRIIVAQDHIPDPPAFDASMITEIGNKTLPPEVQKNTITRVENVVLIGNQHKFNL